MAIVDTLSESSFCNSIKGIRPENFSYEALKALYQYYNDLSEDTGENIEFDPIAICCEWTEYESLEEMQEHYTDIVDMEQLEDRETVIHIEGSESFIVGGF